jgi:ubiquitin-like 1-activating enzyme E1 B
MESVLVVGCGGIGCEVLKLLSRENIGRIVLIDSDTIELSNLSRQFLFGKEDIGRPKSAVAGDVFKGMNGGCEVVSIFADLSVLDSDFFASFDVVFNCLDNDEARTHVNQRCFMSRTLLVDGGSSGFKGQAYFFDYKRECFDCIPKKESREYFTCTIRSRPTKFEHCIAWARDVFIGMLLPKVARIREYHKKYLRGIIENCDDMSDPTWLQKLRKSPGYKKRTLMISRQLKKKKITSFDKDSKECVGLVYNVAWVRAMCAGIEPCGYNEALTIAGNIIPTVSTTNAIVASLMINAMRERCNYYLADSTRVVTRAETYPRNEACPTCSREWFKVHRDGSIEVSDLFSRFEALGYRPLVYSDKESYVTPETRDSIAASHNTIGELMCLDRSGAEVTLNLYFIEASGLSIERQESR